MEASPGTRGSTDPDGRTRAGSDSEKSEVDDDDRLVEPDGLSIRRRRHDRSWSSRELLQAIGRANRVATGLCESITPEMLRSIEERNEPIAFATLRLVARGLDCDPIDILRD